MGKSQRTKGAGFEREVCDVFSAALGQKFKRNIGQARDGGNDIDVGPLVVECKRRKSLKTVEGWLEQANRAARTRDFLGKFGEDDPRAGEAAIPVVVMRADNGVPMVLLTLDDFITLAGAEIKSRLG